MQKIIHIDCDCFYAAVEQRDDPQLIGKPVAVGGHSRTRGVLATCNYEARQFGLHSAMPTHEAFKRCPELILKPVRFDRYRSVSAAIINIFKRFTHVIEPLSLDEAFLDVSDVTQYQGSASRIAEAIRQQIFNEVGITASAGVAPNKFLAKVASDWQKPNGQTVIAPNDVASFVAALPVKRIPGVGKSTLAKMQALHIQRCADLQNLTATELHRHFGRFADRLASYAQGQDPRIVKPFSLRKSISVERTFSQNIAQLSSLQQLMQQLLVNLQQRLVQFKQRIAEQPEQLPIDQLPERYHNSYRMFLQQQSLVSIKSLQLKIKYRDFSVHTRECQWPMALDHAASLKAADFAVLLNKLLSPSGELTNSVRLLGLGVQLEYPAQNLDHHQDNARIHCKPKAEASAEILDAAFYALHDADTSTGSTVEHLTCNEDFSDLHQRACQQLRLRL